MGTMHRLLVLVAIMSVAVVCGCGGAGDEVAQETTGEAPVESSPTGEAPEPEGTHTGAAEMHGATTGEDARARAAGRTIFVQAGCGDCHTLEAAGTTGSVGPNLDEHLKHHKGVEDIEMQIRRGGAGMPSFSGRLSDREIRRLARFLHEAGAS